MAPSGTAGAANGGAGGTLGGLRHAVRLGVAYLGNRGIFAYPKHSSSYPKGWPGFFETPNLLIRVNSTFRHPENGSAPRKFRELSLKDFEDSRVSGRSF